MKTHRNAHKNQGNAPGVFVMPVYLDNAAQSIEWLDKAVGSILQQTDPHWQLVMVNDQSPLPETAEHLTSLQAQDSRIQVITSDINNGAGVARNIGVQWAYDHGCPFVLFQDSDDVSHPDRVKIVRAMMDADLDVGVVYSTFTVIDEADQPVPWQQLSGSIQEILECHRHNPPQGHNAWIEIGTTTGYANLTSTTAVRTEVAIRQPFPNERAIEDAHTWFRYGADGMKFAYTDRIPSLYRIPQHAADSAMRDRMGGVDAYYTKQCDIERDGFAKALAIALANGRIDPDQRDRLMSGYHVRMAESMRRINQHDLARREVERAQAISPRLTQEWITRHGYNWEFQHTSLSTAG